MTLQPPPHPNPRCTNTEIMWLTLLPLWMQIHSGDNSAVTYSFPSLSFNLLGFLVLSCQYLPTNKSVLGTRCGLPLKMQYSCLNWMAKQCRTAATFANLSPSSTRWLSRVQGVKAERKRRCNKCERNYALQTLLDEMHEVGSQVEDEQGEHRDRSLLHLLPGIRLQRKQPRTNINASHPTNTKYLNKHHILAPLWAPTH